MTEKGADFFDSTFSDKFGQKARVYSERRQGHPDSGALVSLTFIQDTSSDLFDLSSGSKQERR